jgi:hypothetical protein
MSRPVRILFLMMGAIVAFAYTADAQPTIFAVPSPPANERGWINTAAQVEFLCANKATSCTGTTAAEREGAEQVIHGTALDGTGATAETAVTLNLDWTSPLVSIESPAPTTTNASIAVVARTSDAVSGPMSAACNGRPAAIGDGGVIRCDVPLSVGANDVVVQVSDRADNSGSAGFRVVRTSSESRLKVVPENVGMIVGQVTTVQVQDGAGVTARGVVWQADNPAVAEMSTDGRHVLTAKTPGLVWITATAAGSQARILVTVYPGDRLPMGSTRWQIGTVMIIQSPDTQPLKAGDTVNAVATRKEPGGGTVIESINRTTGWLNWRERPAASANDTAREIREMPVGGGAAVVFDSTDGRSAVVRSAGAPWRYQSAGQLQPQIVLSTDGSIVVMERTDAGYSQLVVLDGSTGRVAQRRPLPSGTQLFLNVRCVKGAHGVQYVPAQVGPLNPQLRVLHFGLVVSEDREDFGVCGEVTGTFKRTVMIATVGADQPRVDTAATIEVSASGPAPPIELSEVTVDRLGAKLLPWATRDPLTGAREFHVTRLNDDGARDYTLPGVGKIWLSDRDDNLAVTTDGIHLVGFNVVTGAVVVSQAFERGVRIVRVDKGRVFFQHDGSLTAADFPTEPPR